MTTDTRKQAILAALRAFIRQRPGMDPRNYDRGGYRRESREVTRDLHDAETLLRELELRDSITADAILREAGGGGRLTIKVREVKFCVQDPDCKPVNGFCPVCDTHDYKVRYCTGQYFPTEYRKAVARLAAAVLWAHVREHGMPPPGAPTGDGLRYPLICGGKRTWVSGGDWLRAHFRREFGRHIAARYFD